MTASPTADLILTAIARDRPGIVRSLAATIAEHGGNWVDSSMVRFSGEFAGIVHVRVPDQRLAGLERALGGLVDHGITVTARRDAAGRLPAGRRARLEMTGADHEGIIAEISGALARRGVSIEKLTTQVFPASMNGAPMFAAEADIMLPDTLDADALRDELERIARDIMVEVQLSTPREAA